MIMLTRLMIIMINIKVTVSMVLLRKMGALAIRPVNVIFYDNSINITGQF